MQILTLNSSGQPNFWVSPQEAIIYHAKGLVAWELGSEVFDVTFRGGINRLTGSTSIITSAPIIAVSGAKQKAYQKAIPSITNNILFRRDKNTCAYCGTVYGDQKLSRDHIFPLSKGGKNTWENCITACIPCNRYKGNHTLQQADMELRYKPYVPSLSEVLILQNRKILQVQRDYLLASVPANSRVRNATH